MLAKVIAPLVDTANEVLGALPSINVPLPTVICVGEFIVSAELPSPNVRLAALLLRLKVLLPTVSVNELALSVTYAVPLDVTDIVGAFVLRYVPELPILPVPVCRFNVPVVDMFSFVLPCVMVLVPDTTNVSPPFDVTVYAVPAPSVIPAPVEVNVTPLLSANVTPPVLARVIAPLVDTANDVLGALPSINVPLPTVICVGEFIVSAELPNPSVRLAALLLRLNVLLPTVSVNELVLSVTYAVPLDVTDIVGAFVLRYVPELPILPVPVCRFNVPVVDMVSPALPWVIVFVPDTTNVKPPLAVTVYAVPAPSVIPAPVDVNVTPLLSANVTPPVLAKVIAPLVVTANEVLGAALRFNVPLPMVITVGELIVTAALPRLSVSALTLSFT